MNLWLLTCDSLPTGIEDDAPLFAALERLGVQPRWALWSDPTIEWEHADRLLIRSTWDYVQRLGEFRRFLTAPAVAEKLVNPLATVQWNLDKIYLAELASRGVPTIPTLWIAPGAAFAGEVPGDSREIVVKPRISAGAHRTLRLRRDELDGLTLDPSVESGWLVQPLLESVFEQGEVSAIVLDGELSHAARKVPVQGDYRVQPQYGGSLEPATLRDEERDVIGATLAALPVAALYARIDLVADDAGRPRVIEVELIEPGLFLRCGTGAAERLAHAVVRPDLFTREASV